MVQEAGKAFRKEVIERKEGPPVEKKDEVLVLREDQVKTRIVRVEDVLGPQGVEIPESEFGEDKTKTE